LSRLEPSHKRKYVRFIATEWPLRYGTENRWRKKSPAKRRVWNSRKNRQSLYPKKSWMTPKTRSGARIQEEPAGFGSFWCERQGSRMALQTVFAFIGAACGSSLRSASASSRENAAKLDGRLPASNRRRAISSTRCFEVGRPGIPVLSVFCLPGASVLGPCVTETPILYNNASKSSRSR
jgi:hypothetical protein